MGRPAIFLGLALALAVSSVAEVRGVEITDEAKPSPAAQVWFELALALDVGDSGAPDAVRAFAAMRRAADAGHPQAAFNVAVMLDSGRGVTRDASLAAIWYARAAARGVRRAAFNLGQLYEAGEGVTANADLSRAWYAFANLPAARERLTQIKSAGPRPARLEPPQLLFPPTGTSLTPGSQAIDLVWTSPLGPEAVRYFVELRSFDARSSHEEWSGFMDVSSLRLALPEGAAHLAWRVSAVARGAADYVSSDWSVVSVAN